MKLFVWQNLSEVTKRYHSEAGVVILAHDIDRAIEILKKEVLRCHSSYYDGWGTNEVNLSEEDKIEILKNFEDENKEALMTPQIIDLDKEAVFSFQNSGCC